MADILPSRGEALDLLRTTGLDASMLDRYPHEFSGGQRQRIAVMEAGRTVETGLTQEVLAAPRHAHTRALRAARPHAQP